jgi:hypothetical protein
MMKSNRYVNEKNCYITEYETGPFHILIAGKTWKISKKLVDALNSVEWVMDFTKPTWERSITNKLQPLTLKIRDASNATFTAIPFYRVVTGMYESSTNDFRVDPSFQNADQLNITDVRTNAAVLSQMLCVEGMPHYVMISCETTYRGKECLEILEIGHGGWVRFVRSYFDSETPVWTQAFDPEIDEPQSAEDFRQQVTSHAIKNQMEGTKAPPEEYGLPAIRPADLSGASLLIDRSKINSNGKSRAVFALT